MIPIFLSRTYKFCRNLLREISFSFTGIKHHLFHNSENLKLEYLNWLMSRNQQKVSDNFVPICEDSINLKEEQTKLLAFYLPQFHENDVNNKYFGKGFMEWYKVAHAIPQFTGHHQPQLPIDVGFYDLTHDDIMYRQIELAKKYGIYGFCFYYYWFSGEILLEKPIKNFLENKNLKIPFCIMWTNETWTSIWGNGKQEVIRKQELLDEDFDKFADDAIKMFKDERYIKVNNKPLLLIFLSHIFENKKFKAFLKNLRRRVMEEGFDGITLLTTNAGYPEIDIEGLGIDGIVDFLHENLPITKYQANMKNVYINPNFKGKIVDIKRGLKEGYHLYKNPYKTFRCVFPCWDNTARKAYASKCWVFNMTPLDFKKWLKDAINWTKKNHSKEEQFVFLMAWNEWAEGAHMEPDQEYGYANLQIVKEVLEEVE